MAKTTLKTKTDKEYLAEANRLFEENTDFKVYQNHFFSQAAEFLAGRSKEQRKKLVKSDVYRKITKLGDELGLRQGYLVKDKKTGKPVAKEFSGEFRLRIATSLHKELVLEAKREKVSLNQLCLIKLSKPLEEKTAA